MIKKQILSYTTLYYDKFSKVVLVIGSTMVYSRKVYHNSLTYKQIVTLIKFYLLLITPVIYFLLSHSNYS